MKITDNRKLNTFMLKDLNIGDCFSHNDDFYIKISPISCDDCGLEEVSFTSLRLSDCHIVPFNNDADVTKVDIEIIIRD